MRTTPSSFSTLPRASRLYIVAVTIAGCAVLALALASSSFDRPWRFLALLLAAIVVSPVKLRLPLAHGSSSLSVSCAVDFAALVIAGTNEATLVAAVGAWSQCTFRMRERNPLHRTLFSMAALALTMQATGIAYSFARDAGDTMLHCVLVLFAVAVPTYYLINTGLVAGAIAISNRAKLLPVWRDGFLWSAPSCFIGAGVGAGVAVSVIKAYWGWLLLLLVPGVLTYYSYRLLIARIEKEQEQSRRASEVQMSIIQALASAIEAKGGTSHTQIVQMQKHAVALARAVGLPPDEIPGLQTATLLHDIGNLAVPEHILAKPSKLTEEEWAKVRIHPEIGARILEDVPFPYPVAPLVLCHHEHWDGSGYPRGLRGEEIPLGARILAVVDSYTSLSTNRPHRAAMPRAQVFANLQQAAGRILDPSLVKAFLELLPSIESEQQADAPGCRASSVTAGIAGGAERDSANGSCVHENIAVAHQEAHSLYQIAQALGSSLAMKETVDLIASSLRALVPFTTFALFLKAETGRDYPCRHASGYGEERLREISIDSIDSIPSLLDRINEGAAPGQTLGSVVAAPLELDGMVSGMLAIFHTTADCYGPDVRRVLGRVAAQAAPVIRNSTVFEKTQQESFTDHLTGLPNRRSMLLYLNQQISRAERRRSKLALVMIDLNDFKDINDTLGHQVGDRALREVAAVLRSMVRTYDLCVRYGGDEFLVILWECDAEQADRRLRELKDSVRATYFEGVPGECIRLSASAGFAVYPEDGTTQEELIAVADRRMYADKAAQRCKSTLTGPPQVAEAAPELR